MQPSDYDESAATLQLLTHAMSVSTYPLVRVRGNLKPKPGPKPKPDPNPTPTPNPTQVSTYPLVNGATSRGMMRRHYWHTQQLQARYLVITPAPPLLAHSSPNPRLNPEPNPSPNPHPKQESLAVAEQRLSPITYGCSLYYIRLQARPSWA